MTACGAEAQRWKPHLWGEDGKWDKHAVEAKVRPMAQELLDAKGIKEDLEFAMPWNLGLEHRHGRLFPKRNRATCPAMLLLAIRKEGGWKLQSDGTAFRRSLQSVHVCLDLGSQRRRA